MPKILTAHIPDATIHRSALGTIFIFPAFIPYGSWWIMYVYAPFWLLASGTLVLHNATTRQRENYLTVDKFITWLTCYFFLALIMDITANEYYTLSITLAVTIIACMVVVVNSVSERGLLICSLFSTIGIHFVQYSASGISYLLAGNHSMSMIPVLTSLYLVVRQKYRFAALFLLIALPIATRGVLLAYAVCLLMYMSKNLLKLYDRKRVRIVLTILLVLSYIIQVSIGYSEMYAVMLGEISTARSFFYYAIVSSLRESGLDMLFPVSNYNGTALVGQYLAVLDKAPYNFESQCPHSFILESLANYGVLLSILLTGSLVYVANERTWWVILFFLIVSSLQCEYYTYQFFVPIYIVYRLLQLQSPVLPIKNRPLNNP